MKSLVAVLLCTIMEQSSLMPDKANARPQVTVAAIAEVKGQFLMVEERVKDRTVYNQPAGHLEADESLEAAVCREVLEETCLRFAPEFVVGLYRWRNYIRVAFGGRVSTDPVSGHELDRDVVAVHWLSEAQINQLSEQRRLRSPLVLAGIKDYRCKHAYPLSLLRCVGNKADAP